MSSRYKKGQSGNPKGRPKKPKSDLIDIKSSIERMLKKERTLGSGEQSRPFALLKPDYCSLDINLQKATRKHAAMFLG